MESNEEKADEHLAAETPDEQTCSAPENLEEQTSSSPESPEEQTSSAPETPPAGPRHSGIAGAMIRVAKNPWNKLRAATMGITRAFLLIQSEREQYKKKTTQALKAAEAGNTRVKLEVKKSADLDKIKYINQGNKEFYSTEAVNSRYNLRTHKGVVGAIQRWWEWVPKRKVNREAPGIPPQQAITRPAYCATVTLLQQVLLPKFGLTPDKNYDPQEDWESDSRGLTYITFPNFFDAMFELVDIWCEEIDGDAYCSLLDSLFNAVKAQSVAFAKLLKKYGWEDEPPEETPPPSPGPKAPREVPVSDEDWSNLLSSVLRREEEPAPVEEPAPEPPPPPPLVVEPKVELPPPTPEPEPAPPLEPEAPPPPEPEPDPEPEPEPEPQPEPEPEPPPEPEPEPPKLPPTAPPKQPKPAPVKKPPEVPKRLPRLSTTPPPSPPPRPELPKPQTPITYSSSPPKTPQADVILGTVTLGLPSAYMGPLSPSIHGQGRQYRTSSPRENSSEPVPETSTTSPEHDQGPISGNMVLGKFWNSAGVDIEAKRRARMSSQRAGNIEPPRIKGYENQWRPTPQPDSSFSLFVVEGKKTNSQLRQSHQGSANHGGMMNGQLQGSGGFSHSNMMGNSQGQGHGGLSSFSMPLNGHQQGYGNSSGQNMLMNGQQQGYGNSSGQNMLMNGQQQGYGNYSGQNMLMNGQQQGYGNSSGQNMMMNGQQQGYGSQSMMMNGQQQGYGNQSGHMMTNGHQQGYGTYSSSNHHPHQNTSSWQHQNSSGGGLSQGIVQGGALYSGPNGQHHATHASAHYHNTPVNYKANPSHHFMHNSADHVLLRNRVRQPTTYSYRNHSSTVVPMDGYLAGPRSERQASEGAQQFKSGSNRFQPRSFVSLSLNPFEQPVRDGFVGMQVNGLMKRKGSPPRNEALQSPMKAVDVLLEQSHLHAVQT